MKRLIFFFLLFIVHSEFYGQVNPEEIFSKNVIDTVDIGKPFIRHIKIDTTNQVFSVSLIPIKSRFRRKVFSNSHFLENTPSNYLKKNRKIYGVLNGISNDTISIIFQPLRANKMFATEIISVPKTINIYDVFWDYYLYQIEDNKSIFKKQLKNNWITKYKELVNLNKEFNFSFTPTKVQLNSILSECLMTDISKDKFKLFKSIFKTTELDEYIKILDTNLIKNVEKFHKEVLDNCSGGCDDDVKPELAVKFSSIFNLPDFKNFEKLFNTFLSEGLNTKVNTKLELIENILEMEDSLVLSLKDKINRDYYDDFIPNIFNYKRTVRIKKNFVKKVDLMTFNATRSGYYSRTLTPDFGFVGFLYNDFGTLGVPYVGIHVSLFPSNREVPLGLKKYSLLQRLSLHIGFTRSNIQGDGTERKEFFDNTSLLIGGGYNCINNSFRVIGGTLIYRDINRFTSNEEYGFMPYLGVSLDIQLRKWLESTASTFTDVLKRN